MRQPASESLPYDSGLVAGVAAVTAGVALSTVW